MGTATHGFQIQLRQNGPKKPYRGAIPTLASIRICLILKAFCESNNTTRTQMRTCASSRL